MSNIEVEYQRKICNILNAIDDENITLATELLKDLKEEDIPADIEEFPAPFHLAGLIAGRSIVLSFAGSEVTNSEMDRILEGLVDGLNSNMEILGKKTVNNSDSQS